VEIVNLDHPKHTIRPLKLRNEQIGSGRVSTDNGSFDNFDTNGQKIFQIQGWQLASDP
jgi:hypothetical protein